MTWLFLMGLLGAGMLAGGWYLVSKGNQIIAQYKSTHDSATGMAGGVTKLGGIVIMVVGGLILAAAIIIPFAVVPA